MKKLLAALLALSMLAACGGSSDDDDGAASDDGGAGGNAGKAPAATTGFDGTTITLGAITPQTGVAEPTSLAPSAACSARYPGATSCSPPASGWPIGRTPAAGSARARLRR